jgi:hypothetical protein
MEPGPRRLANRPLTEPHPSRLAPDHPLRAQILDAHAAAMAARQPMYTDPVSGCAAFTAAHLVERGWCCDKGCRRRPYLT